MLQNVGDRFVSSIVADADQPFDPNGFTGEPQQSLTFEVDQNLDWENGQAIQFAFTFNDGRDRESIFQGGVRGYNPDTGIITIGAFGGIFFRVAGDRINAQFTPTVAPYTVTLTSIFPAGAQGPQGEPGVDGTDGIDGIDGTNGVMGERGFVGPFVSSIYFVRNDGEAAPDRSTLPNQNLVAESGFSGTQNTVSWDRFESRLTGGSGNGRNCLLYTSPSPRDS